MRTALRLAFAIAALALAGCSSGPDRIEPDRTAPIVGPSVPIAVVSHGWHTGLILPAADLNREIPELAAEFPGRAHYEIGWGDAGFYQSHEITTGLTLRAMFWSSGSVIHVVAFDTPPDRAFPGSRVRRVTINARDYRTLLRFVRSAFAKHEDGRVVALRRGLYGDSRFYDGVGNYHMFNTCNKWTAKALYSGGLDISTRFKLTASSVMDALPEEPDAAARPE